MKKRVIRLGDPTTHGGTVVSATAGYIMFDKEVAALGDKATCPIPGHGTVVIVEGDPTWTVNGKNVALEGHKCSCGCSLISTLPNVERSYEGMGTASFGAIASGAIIAEASKLTGYPQRHPDEDVPDEQIRAVDDKTGDPIPDLAYYIKTRDGSVYSGYTNQDGLCKRIETPFPEELQVWFGEEAEERMQAKA